MSTTATLHLLGTGAALAGPDRTTTMLAFEAGSVIVVDCGADVVHRLLAGGVDLDAVAALVVTHEHPDHVGGFPLFVEKMWLAQRRRPIPVCGPAAAIRQARTIFEAFDTSGWRGLPEIEWREVSLDENAEVWADEWWRVTAAPGRHSVPVIGLRFEEVGSGRSVVYSSDTEKAEAIVELARGAEILVHEATGAMKGHTSARGAAEVARDAGVGRLVLVHLPPDPDETDLREAREIFPDLEIGSDGLRYHW